MRFLLIFLISCFIYINIHSQDFMSVTPKYSITDDSVSLDSIQDSFKDSVNLIDSNLSKRINDTSINDSSVLSRYTINVGKTGKPGYYPEWKFEKNYWVPTVGVLGVNGVFAFWNRFVTKKPYGYINLESVKDNFRHGWVWDDNNWNVNQIGHPYQGGLYYSMAKYYGHGYIASTLFTMFGSWQWEMFMEKEWAAINDLATTTFGGSMMGEMLYHLSEKILDDNSRGAERFFRELGAGLVNPILGVNRLIHAESWSKGVTRRRTDPGKNVTARVSLGGKLDYNKNEEDSTKVGSGSFRSNVVYGNPYKVKRPFDFFFMDIGLSLEENTSEEEGGISPIIDIRAQGVLYNKRLNVFKNRTLLSVFQNFDFIGSQLYKIGSTSFGLGIGASHAIGQSKWGFSYSVQLNGIIMGGASTEYYFNDERDYNLGPGAGLKTIFAIGKHNFGGVAIRVDRYWIHTFSGAEGDELVGVGTLEFDKSIWRGLGACLAYNFYDRYGRYSNYNPELDNIKFKSHEFKLFLTYSWN